MVFERPRATIAKSLRAGALNGRNVLLHGPGGQKPESEVSPGPVRPRSLFVVCGWPSSPCPCVVLPPRVSAS